MATKNDIQELSPKALWKNFHKICQTPHPSHHLEAISKMIMDFAQQLNLEAVQDEVGNILIRKPATKGMENRKTTILQAHLDMVPQKDSSVNHNFETDAIQTIIDGDWVKADRTTLGADNGIGVAAAMAVLESKEIQHGTLEVLLTADEETNMVGAFGLKPEFLEGDILLNLDSESEGELYVGCAGGIDANISWKFIGEPSFADDIALKVTLKNLKGGHSGLEIDLGRANANKLLFRFLKEAIISYEARLAQVEGGNMRNAIPREASAIISIPTNERSNIEKLISEYEALFNEEYKAIENTIILTVEEVEMPETIIPEEVQDDLVNAITACPNGVFRFIPEIPEIVETSNNLSIVTSTADTIEVKCLLRSSVDSKKEELASMVESVFTLAGAKVEFSGSYSGWNPNLKSAILKEMSELYLEKFGVAAKVQVIHAGLECGVIGATYPNLDMISFGPTICHPHSPDEKVNIPSVQKFWNFLVATLENIPTK
ncbi:MAG: aminoacyl-histidine dipeptidase [Paludibacteraceae bacterium]|jgi:dipeptidase D